MFKKKNINVAIFGMGYVGLPLALEFSKKFNVTGYDVNKKRILELKNGFDITKEVSEKSLKNSKKLKFTHNLNSIKNVNVFIVTVPTPVYKNKKPDLRSLVAATKAISKILKLGNTIVYESTVYPGTTEEVCIPIIEKISKLKLNKDFYCGYSPERINPSDSIHKLRNTNKIISGSNIKTVNFLYYFYKQIIDAKVFKANSIKVAEAAKIIENTQRDLNIALINELSIIFNKLNIDTHDVLKAAATKWNFINFSPGLVGGHCIGVDPYYLTYKSERLNYSPKIILSGRELNDSMPTFIVKKLLSTMKKRNITITKAKILVLGASFKENCRDTRNSKVVDLILEFQKKVRLVDIYDPLIDYDDFENNFKIKPLKKIKRNYYDALVLAVPHKNFITLGIKKLKLYLKKNSIFFDLKSVFKKSESDLRL